MKKLTIINEIYVILNLGLELNLNLNYAEFKIMIKKAIIKNNSYMDHCHSDLYNEIKVLKGLIDLYSDKEDLFNEAMKFINAFAEVIKYEKCSIDIEKIEKDKLYYKAVLNNFYIEDVLINNKNQNSFEKFKKEFFEIGVLISKFYKGSNEIIINMINSKVEDLFERYNFFYTLPECCK
ncbi:MAG: hypothetical protein ACRC68_12530 [Clostridium sp.]